MQVWRHASPSVHRIAQPAVFHVLHMSLCAVEGVYTNIFLSLFSCALLKSASLGVAHKNKPSDEMFLKYDGSISVGPLATFFP